MKDERHLILYDGVCGLCNGLVQFVLRRDRKDRFRFAALQGDVARAQLRPHGRSPDDLDTFFLVADFEGKNPRLLDRDRAALFVLVRLGFPWWVAGVFRLVPRFLRRPVYNFIARRRYRWFGKFRACPLPSPEVRHKFL